MRREGAYDYMQATKPQTLAYALNDSPAGLAAWIVEKFRSWSDCGGDVERRFTKDELLTNVTLYWVTETINSSKRLYFDRDHAFREIGADDRVRVPRPSRCSPPTSTTRRANTRSARATSCAGRRCRAAGTSRPSRSRSCWRTTSASSSGTSVERLRAGGGLAAARLREHGELGRRGRRAAPQRARPRGVVPCRRAAHRRETGPPRVAPGAGDARRPPRGLPGRGGGTPPRSPPARRLPRARPPPAGGAPRPVDAAGFRTARRRRCGGWPGRRPTSWPAMERAPSAAARTTAASGSSSTAAAAGIAAGAT